MHQRKHWVIETVDDYKASMEEALGIPYDEFPEDLWFSDEEIEVLFLSNRE